MKRTGILRAGLSAAGFAAVVGCASSPETRESSQTPSETPKHAVVTPNPPGWTMSAPYVPGFPLVLAGLLLPQMPPGSEPEPKDRIEGACKMDFSSKGGPDGLPCDGFDVVLFDKFDNEFQRATTDAKGNFRFMAVPNGIYSLKMRSDLYQLWGGMGRIKPGHQVRLILTPLQEGSTAQPHPLAAPTVAPGREPDFRPSPKTK